MKNYGLLIILSLFIQQEVCASDAKIPCLKGDGSVGLNGLEKYDCSLVKSAVSNPELMKAHEKRVQEKLAEKLAFKIDRSMEEMAQIDQYFSQYDLELTKSESVKKACRVEVIAYPKDCKASPEKLKLLLSKLPSKGNSLADKLASRFLKTRGAEDEKDKRQCPLVNPSGYYILKQQFDDQSALSVINSFKNKKIGMKDAFFNQFPQLKIVANSSEEFVKQFEQHLKSYNKDVSPKDYLLQFFKSDSNQEPLSRGLSQTCVDLSNNIKQFLCEDPKSLAMTERTANYLFDDSEEEDREVSNAFSCEYKDKEHELLDKSASKNSIDNLFLNLQENTVNALPKKSRESEIKVKAFCELYECKNESSKLNACKNGGPISSSGLLSEMGCILSSDGQISMESSQKCTSDIVKNIYYLQSIEKGREEQKKIVEGYKLATSASSDAKVDKPKRSVFFENFVGVEKSVLSSGRDTTPMNIAEKAREFEERKIEVIPQANKETILANNADNKVYNVLNAQKQEEALQQQSQANQQAIQSFASFKDDGEEEKKAVIAQSISKFSKSKSTEQSKDEFQNMKERARTDEIKRMRSELENVMKGMGGSEEEKLATVATHNESLAAAPKTAAATTNLGSDERERLESYRKSLQNWEGRIREREYDLNDREFRSPRSAASDEANPADKRYDSVNANQQQNSGAGSAGGSANAQGIKLSKAGGSQNAAASSEANGEVGSKSQVDGEAIVTVEALAKLEKANLKTLGIGFRDSFIIKVRHNEKLYDVPVKSFTHNGKSMFVPLLNNQNRELAKIILESPLFAEYRQYQIQRSQAEI